MGFRQILRTRSALAEDFVVGNPIAACVAVVLIARKLIIANRLIAYKRRIVVFRVQLGRAPLDFLNVFVNQRVEIGPTSVETSVAIREVLILAFRISPHIVIFERMSDHSVRGCKLRRIVNAIHRIGRWAVPVVRSRQSHRSMARTRAWIAVRCTRCTERNHLLSC